FRLVFFFQAEDGIRDFHVTGVQTCALPILEEWDIRTADNMVVEWGERDGQRVMEVRTTGPGPARLVLEHAFEYRSNPPDTFILQVPYAFTGEGGATGQAVIRFETADGRAYDQWMS